MNKLYVIVPAKLSFGEQTAQTGHGVAAFAVAHTDLFLAWATPQQRNIACLEAPDLEVLLLRLQAADTKLATFRETDMSDALTAIACEEGAARLLSSLPKAGRDPLRPTKAAPFGYVAVPFDPQ